MKKRQTKDGPVVTFLITDIVSVIGAALIAWFSTPTEQFSVVVLLWILANVLAVVGALFVAQAYSIVLKAASLFDAFRIALAIIIVCIINTTFAIVTDGEYITKGTSLLFGLMLFNLVIATRFYARLLGVFNVFFGKGAKGRARVMIVGGGEAATLIVKELLTSEYAKQ